MFTTVVRARCLVWCVVLCSGEECVLFEGRYSILVAVCSYILAFSKFGWNSVLGFLLVIPLLGSLLVIQLLLLLYCSLLSVVLCGSFCSML